MRQRTCGAFSEPRERSGEIVGRSGADVTQILGDDQVGREFFESLGVDGVEAFAARDVFANLAVDFRRRCVVRNSRLDDDSLGAGRGRKVAFVADADDLAVETEGEENFGGGGQTGTRCA